MSPVCLFSETVVQDSGFGPVVDLGEASNKPLLLTLSITRMMEEHTLCVTVWGSPDRVDWGSRPVAVLPNRYYCGEYQHLLDLSSYPAIRHLRLEYNFTGWGYDDRAKVSSFSLSASLAHDLVMAAAY